MIAPRWSNNYPLFYNKSINKIYYNHLMYSKSKIDNFKTNEKKKKWGKFARLLNLYENILYIESDEKISRAFYKLIEINKNFNIFTKEETLTGHLCEAPGGFIEATCDIIKNKNHKWVTQSILDSNCTFSKKLPKNGKFLKGKDNTGDIYNIENIIDFSENCKKKCDVITADGGFDVSKNYYIQEQLSFRIIFCQFVTALKSLKKGGHFICKIFDMFTLPTIQFIKLCKFFFTEVHIFKPLSSRPCNSEKYLILKNYVPIRDLTSFIETVKKWPKNLFIVDLGIPLEEEFLNKIKKLNNSLVEKQIEHLDETYKYATQPCSKDWFIKQKTRQNEAAVKYIEHFRT